MGKLKSLFIFIAFAIIMFVAYVIFSSFFEPGVYNLMVRNFVASQKGSDGIIRHYDPNGVMTGFSQKGGDGITRHYDNNRNMTGYSMKNSYGGTSYYRNR